VAVFTYRLIKKRIYKCEVNLLNSLGTVSDCLVYLAERSVKSLRFWNGGSQVTVRSRSGHGQVTVRPR